MAEYYGTAIIPARPYSPKDKPNAEGTVGVISTWIIAAPPQSSVLFLIELNAAIQEKLTEFNKKPFQKRKAARFSAFEEEGNPSSCLYLAASYENGCLVNCYHPNLIVS